ncbi:MAG: IS66 family insertion sequence element accessory protein TnpB [Planctomycetota bacterium]
MISLPTNLRIFVARDPADMRKGFNGLQGLVTTQLEEDPLSGHLFLFLNRRGDRVKVFYWDGDGLAIWYKRLEQGRFQLPPIEDDQSKLEIRSDELAMLLGGIDVRNLKRTKRYSLDQ